MSIDKIYDASFYKFQTNLIKNIMLMLGYLVKFVELFTPNP